MSYNEPPNYGSPPPPSGGGYTGQPPYGGQPAFGGREHPHGTAILILGIFGLLCCFPLGIAAWVMGNSAIKEFDANPGMYASRGMVNTGRVLGIIATILWATVIAGYVLLFVLGVALTAGSTAG